MEGRGKAKGTVTSLSSIIPVEEALKASNQLIDKIIDKQNEVETLNNFISDNINLINLVQRLPDELHHNIMVPFGKAAFFPGRLVHTNEFMVFLGEGYYAERTAKQTVDILKRRGNTLESQVDAVKAVIEDIKAKASFFDRTAAEAAEGLVEIREEYTDDEDYAENLKKSDAPSISEVNNGAGAADDEEYARIMSRFDELEREELEAEEQEDDESDEDSTNLDHENSVNQAHFREISSVSQPNHVDMIKLENLSLQPGHRDESSRDKNLMQIHSSNTAEKYPPPSILKSSVQSNPKNNSKVSFQLPKPDAGSMISRPVSNVEPDAASQLSRPLTDSLKAFSGTIVERADNLQTNPEKQTSQPSSSQPSRPVSRFKMQRR